MTLTFAGPDGKPRCKWCDSAPDFYHYHDTEWGFPVDDDYRLFEKICLEGFQSGLSWRTILAKRENFRAAFDHFDFAKIATYDENKRSALVNDAGIIRHQGKINAVINNAQRALEMKKEFGSLAHYFWQWEETNPDAPPQTRSTSALSTALSKDLKKRGWKFVGPTTIFAFMQAMGLINDHVEGCTSRPLVEKARATFVKP